MYTKLSAIMLMAALAAVLITSTTLAATEDAEAKRQKLEQKNKDCNNCANVGVQNQGRGNSVSISVSQNN